MAQRTLTNRIKAWTGTVHYAQASGHTLCGAHNTTYSRYTTETVNCKRCEAIGGKDTEGTAEPQTTHYADDHAARRATERAARRAERDVWANANPNVRIRRG